ncbi:MAG: phenylacetate--CoA ligase [Bacteroidaceae bacterium]|nr:phenylacetate--CoA ligase [Bacteroidales bacterium]MBO5264033.1 phenylacetate--CoA ligase [Bacteroidaceae bacterium]MBQ8256328.1 phenylacetate--CoA ligase [Bacteroidaceae bacterium]
MDSKYFEPQIETMPRAELEKLQLERLKKTIEQAVNSPFYKKLYSELGITADTVKSLDDIRKLPFTTKQDMRDNYPFGFLACDQKEVTRLHSSSGTTGNPTVICHTKNDLDTWANRVARSFYMVGLRNSDVIQNSSGYGMFTGGLGMQAGIERLGALSIPAAAGNSLRQIKFIMDFGTTAIHAIPSYALRLADVFEEVGIDPKTQTHLTTFLIGAEPHTEETRRKIEERFGVKAYNSFGMTEMSGPGVAFECQEQNGMHIWEDSYLVEIVDPDTLEPVPDGEVGELVLTTLDREAMPLIRYRTRDLTRFLVDECPCGRTHRRLDRMKGRSDDMFIVKGVNIFPMQIEKILMQFPELGTNYLITIEPIDNNDVIFVDVELNSLTTDDYTALQNLSKEITRRIKDEILVTPKVRLLSKGALPQSEGKAVRVKDLRKK